MCGGGALRPRACPSDRPYRIRWFTGDSLGRPRTPGPTLLEACEGSALAVDLAVHDLVFTRGTPPRTEGCRTVGRGLMTVTHDLSKNLGEMIGVPQPGSGSRDARHMERRTAVPPLRRC
ncbi:hypothetical protein GCM10010095_30450 [Streptomyces anthocyanicus]|nr:hypothetical protein GCM10010095_30450 [Streptomyces anthocyanicus]